MALAKWVLKLQWDILSITAEKHGLEPELVAAVAYQESGGRRYAVRYEPNWGYLYWPGRFAGDLGISIETETQLQKMSFSYMQVMGSVARELGFTDSLVQLCEPFNAYEYGCKKLAQCQQRYPNNMRAAVAAYNGGSATLKADGATYRNESYVVAVMGYYQNLVR